MNTRNPQALTIDQLSRLAPSALALTAASDRSSRYAYIPTIDLIRGMKKTGFLPFEAVQSKSRAEGRRNHAKHMIRFRQLSSLRQPLSEGVVLPEIVLINSHDGSSAYRLMLGLFRVVCSNGLLLPEGTEENICIRHFGDVVDVVIERSAQIMKRAPQLLSTVRSWASMQLSFEEQNSLAEAALYARFPDLQGKINAPITPAQLLEPRRSADVGSDLWRTLNRIQENAIRGGLQGVQDGRSVVTREIKEIDRIVKLNCAFWGLAETLSQKAVYRAKHPHADQYTGSTNRDVTNRRSRLQEGSGRSKIAA